LLPCMLPQSCIPLASLQTHSGFQPCRSLASDGLRHSSCCHDLTQHVVTCRDVSFCFQRCRRSVVLCRRLTCNNCCGASAGHVVSITPPQPHRCQHLR
jgi:hypothetical protein